MHAPIEQDPENGAWSGFGAGNETRTRDLNLGKVALYQLSYSRKIKRACYRNHSKHTSFFTLFFTSRPMLPDRVPACHRGEKQGPEGALSKSGAGNETRTRDLNLGKVALYQLSYSRRLSLAPTAPHPGVLEAVGPSTCVEGALFCRNSFTSSTSFLLHFRALPRAVRAKGCTPATPASPAGGNSSVRRSAASRRTAASSRSATPPAGAPSPSATRVWTGTWAPPAPLRLRPAAPRRAMAGRPHRLPPSRAARTNGCRRPSGATHPGRVA